MIIYNTTWLKNLIIQEEMKKAYRGNDLKPEELQAVLEKYPVGFYSSNLFLRIGLFLATNTLSSFVFGLLALMLSNSSLLESPAFSLFLGLCSYIALEIVVRSFHHYKSGVDDALMWTSASLLMVAVFIAIDSRAIPFKDFSSELIISGFFVLLGSYFTLRFANMLMALVTFCALIAFVFFGWYSYGFYALLTMPFLMMILSLLIYFFALKLEKKHWIYKNCLGMLQLASLLTLYAAGNYFVVREVGSSMNEDALSPDQAIPLAWFFWLWTVFIPILYLTIGLKKKNVLLIRSGLILVAAAAFTIRNYYHALNVEIILTVFGALLLGISYGLMRYLKTPKHGFTVEELDDLHLLDKLKVESLIVVGTVGDGTSVPEGSRMGGGDFGGGGASGNF